MFSDNAEMQEGETEVAAAGKKKKKKKKKPAGAKSVEGQGSSLQPFEITVYTQLYYNFGSLF